MAVDFAGSRSGLHSPQLPMHKAFVSTATALVSLTAIFLLVQFLGVPVQSETVQAGIVHRSLRELGSDTLPDPAHGQVVGQVVDKRGNALRGVRVIASPPNPIVNFRLRQRKGPDELLGETWTDEHGQFVLEGLAPGSVRIWAGGDRWLYAPSHVVEVRGGHAAQSVTVPVEPRPARG